jgi:hypothetical protein
LDFFFFDLIFKFQKAKRLLKNILANTVNAQVVKIPGRGVLKVLGKFCGGGP